MLKERAKLTEADFQLLALAVNRARVKHQFLWTAWGFLPDHWHAICAPPYPLTINEYSGMSAEEQKQSCGLTIDRVNLPSDPQTRI